MSISGSLEDVSVADVMQFIHLGQRTGTLVLHRDGEQARIGFHCGKLVSAQVPGRPKLGALLVSSKLLSEPVLEEAIELQDREPARRSLGQILVDRGQVDPEQLRGVIVQQIENNVSEAVTWNSGTFEFVVDDLRPVDDIALYPGDVVPDADINTQMVLLEAARIFDERSRGEPGSVVHPRVAGERADETNPIGVKPGREPAATSQALPPAAAEGVSRAAALTLLEPDLLEGVIGEAEEGPPPDYRHLWLDIVSRDQTFVRRLRRSLPDGIFHVAESSVAEAGAAPPQAIPIAVIDLRGEAVTLEQIRDLHHARPHIAILALVEPGQSFARPYAAGARAALPAEVDGVVACVENLLQEMAEAPAVSKYPPADTRGGVARLRRVFGDLRSGLISATVALNLMHIISESVERAVLFLVKREELAALGAFGAGSDGRPLAELTRGLKIALTEENALTWSLDQGEARSYGFEEARLAPELMMLVGRPANGQVVVFPVLGAQRVIAIIYTDNGDHDEAIEDIEILELATAQVGMAFENELLRRQISQKS